MLGAAPAPPRTLLDGCAAPDAPLLPADVLDLREWLLQLPDGHDGDPDTVQQPRLATFSRPGRLEVTSTGGAVLFTAPCGGATTSGSQYPRTELRETTGGARAAWNPAEGTHVMTARLAITRLPRVKADVIAAQIHNGDSDLAVVHLRGRTLTVRHFGSTVATLTTAYELGTYVDLEHRVTGGRLTVLYDGRRVVDRHVGWDEPTCYFKAGAYVQSNPDRGDDPDTVGQVKISALTVTHGP